MSRARAAAASPTGELTRYGLARLSGGMTHDVFACEDEPTMVVKVFRSSRGSEPTNEWNALVTLADSGLAPAPIAFDRGTQPVVVMERVQGSSLVAQALGPKHAAAIGSAHRLVHATTSAERRRRSTSGLHRIRLALMLPRPRHWRGGDSAEVINDAWRAARSWAREVHADRLFATDHARFSRGDPNLTNYLWREDEVVLIDWEDSGYNDPALQLADMAEHPSTRTLTEQFWADVAAATELTPGDRERVAQGRRAMACFWLVVIENRQRQGRPTTVTLEEQAARTLATLDR